MFPFLLYSVEVMQLILGVLNVSLAVRSILSFRGASEKGSSGSLLRFAYQAFFSLPFYRFPLLPPSGQQEEKGKKKKKGGSRIPENIGHT
jgi:hypothetical protein